MYARIFIFILETEIQLNSRWNGRFSIRKLYSTYWLICCTWGFVWATFLTRYLRQIPINMH